MPDANVALAERCIEAIGRRDVATLVELSTEDVEIRPLRALLEDTVYRGYDGINQWMRDLDEAWRELRIEIEDVRAPSPDTVVALTTLQGRGHGSEAPVSMAVALTATIRDGRVSHAAVHVDRDAALRSATGG